MGLELEFPPDSPPAILLSEYLYRMLVLTLGITGVQLWKPRGRKMVKYSAISKTVARCFAGHFVLRWEDHVSGFNNNLPKPTKVRHAVMTLDSLYNKLPRTCVTENGRWCCSTELQMSVILKSFRTSPRRPNPVRPHMVLRLDLPPGAPPAVLLDTFLNVAAQERTLCGRANVRAPRQANWAQAGKETTRRRTREEHAQTT